MWGNFSVWDIFKLLCFYCGVPLIIGGVVGFILGKWVF